MMLIVMPHTASGKYEFDLSTSTLDPGVAFTLRDAAYAPNAIAAPAAMRNTPNVRSATSRLDRPVFNFISSICALNRSLRLVGSVIVVRPSSAQVSGRQFRLDLRRRAEGRDPAVEHDPSPVGDSQHR